MDRRVEWANILGNISILIRFIIHEGLEIYSNQHNNIKACYIGPLNLAIYGIRVASVIAFSVLYLFSVLCGFVIFFLILLQYNIWPLSPNCDMCDPKFVPRVNLRRHDTFTQTVMNVMTIFC